MLKMEKIFHLIFRLLFLLEGGVWSLRDLTISVPEAVLSGTEASAVLRCDYELEGAALYSLRWYRADTEFYRYVPREHPPAMVFPLMGTSVDLSRSDDHQVVLVGLHRRLSGLYQCEVSADAPLFHTDIRAAALTVVDPPFVAPRLLLSRATISQGAPLTAVCSVDAAYPQPNITWTINDVPIARLVSPAPAPDDFSERGATSALRLTLVDAATAAAAATNSSDVTNRGGTGDYYNITTVVGGHSGGDEAPPMHVMVSVRAAQRGSAGAALRCAADILGVHRRHSPPAPLLEDAPAHDAVTTDDHHRSSSSSPRVALLLVLSIEVLLYL